MKHAIDLAERIPGTYWHAAAILKLELDAIVRRPLEEVRLTVGGGAITRRVDAKIGTLYTGPASLRVPLQWEAAEHPGLFPVMNGELRVSDVGGNGIELRLVGEYRTPLGAVGAVGDTLAGHRVAEKSLRALLTDVARQLEAKLAARVGRTGRDL